MSSFNTANVFGKDIMPFLNKIWVTTAHIQSYRVLLFMCLARSRLFPILQDSHLDRNAPWPGGHPKPPLPPPPTSRHGGIILLSCDTEVACSNPYLIQPFHIWIISQAGDHFPGHKDWLPGSATQVSPDQHCGGLGGHSTTLASFPLSGDNTFLSHFSFFDRQTASLPSSKLRMLLQDLLSYRCFRQSSALSWPWCSWVPSWQCLFSWTPLCGAGIMQSSAPSWDIWAVPTKLQNTVLGTDPTQARFAGTVGNAKGT